MQDNNLSLISLIKDYHKIAITHTNKRGKMKIGIVTQPLLGNYGGILQNYALQQILRRLGHSPQTIDYIMHNSSYRYFRHTLKYKLRKLLKKVPVGQQPPTRLRLRNSTMECFIQKHIATTQSITRYESDLIKQYGFEAIVVGSDQVWRPKYNNYLEDMFLRFAQHCAVQRVAYAASFGVDKWEYSFGQTRRCRKLASLFDAVSVRERSGEKLCSQRLNISATTVLDPTLLLTAADYGELCKDIPADNESVLAAYFLKAHNKKRIENNQRFVENMAAMRNLKVKSFTADTAEALSVEEWLATFRDAKMIVTESFHGTVFSILNHREFLTLGNASRGLARLNTLLGALGLENRLVSPDNLDLQTLPAIDWNDVDQRLNQLREHSIRFLQDALNK